MKDKVGLTNGFYTHEKFGSVPNGWEVAKLGDCFDFFPTASYSRALLSENDDCGYIHYGDIHTRFDRFIDANTDTLPFISKDMAKKYTPIADGDLIISDASEDYEGVGKSVEVINVGEKVIISGLHTLHLRVKNNDFITGLKGYILNQEKVRNSILRIATGIKVYSVSKTELKKVLLPKPPKDEQIQITNILSLVDSAIKATEDSIKAAEKLKKGLMQKLLTGKLKHDGTLRKEEDFYKDEKFGNLPKGWVYDRVKNLTLKVTDGEHLSPEFQNTGSYLLSAEDVFDNGISFEKAKYVRPLDCKKFRKRCDPEYGDVLIVSRGASIGRSCKVDTHKEFCLMGSVILIKPNNDVLHGGFLAQYFKSYKAWVELQKLSGTTAQQAIYLTHIKKVKLLYPSDTIEQEQISKILESFDNEVAQKNRKIVTLQRLKKSLMQNLLTGKVRVEVEKINKVFNELAKAL